MAVDNKASLDNATKKWYSELNRLSPDIPKLFAGNKVDMR